MKASKNTERVIARRTRAMGLMGAIILSAVMLLCVACTGNDMPDNKETTGTSGTTAGTTAGTTTEAPSTSETESRTEGTTTGGGTTAKPLDPDAGTVDSNAGTGEPPAGTGTGKGRGFRSHFMP